MERLQTLYASYLIEVEKAAAQLSPMDGVAGFGAGLAGAHCHDQFIADFERLMAEMAGELDSFQARQALEFIYRAPIDQANQTVYWVFIAVHGLTEPLIRLLNRQDAAALCDLYQQLYARWERLPAQQKILKTLRERAR